MQKGTTYMVRPAMHPAYNPVRIAFMGRRVHPVVGGPGTGRIYRANVGATPRPERHRWGRTWPETSWAFAVSRVKVPDSTSLSVIATHSAAEPSLNTTSSGRVSPDGAPTILISAGT